MKPKIGILGGIGPESSAKFYTELIQRVQKQGIKSNRDYPHIILESIPAPELLLKKPSLSMYKTAIINLEKAGADFIVIVCNTAHIFLEKFQKLVNIPIIDLKEEVEKELKKQKIDTITIVGSKKTVSKLFDFNKINIVGVSDEDSEIIDKIILAYNVGARKELQKAKLTNLLEKYSENKILIACTELSSILKDTDKQYLDTFDILLNSTIEKWNTLKP